jgi:hypothetical protein
MRQTASRCAPADHTGLSPGEKAQLFQEFDQWQVARQDDATGEKPSLIASASNARVLPACSVSR